MTKRTIPKPSWSSAKRGSGTGDRPSRRRRTATLLAIVLAAGGAVAGVELSGGATPRHAAGKPPTSSSGAPLSLLYGTLAGVACPSAGRCLAVGDFLPYDADATTGDPDGDGQATHTLVEISDGDRWRRIASPDAGKGGSVLDSIACPTASDCVAVGSYKESLFGPRAVKAPPTFALIERSSASGWHVVQGLGTAPNTTLASVACPSPVDCIAVGADAIGLASGKATESPVVEQLHGGAWHEVTPPTPAGTSAGLTSVACTGHASCVAVGEIAPASDPTATRPLIEELGVAGWSEVPLPAGSAGPGVLDDVTCAAAGRCFAAGTSAALRASGAGLLLDDVGGTWSTDRGALAVRGDVTFTAVGCVTGGDCDVVGTSALGLGGIPTNVAARIRDGAWTVIGGAGSPGVVDAIACPGASACIGVGSRTVNDFGNTTISVAELDAAGWHPLDVPAP